MCKYFKQWAKVDVESRGILPFLPITETRIKANKSSIFSEKCVGVGYLFSLSLTSLRSHGDAQ